jgi:acyl-CoA synthetase (AMP-forming)/AMP-acid ligase II
VRITDAEAQPMAITYPDVWETIADTIPDADAVIQGDRVVSWRDYDDRSARLAGAFLNAGLGHESKIGMFMYNAPEYLETQYASFKIRATPINVNYRYLADELVYLLDNADCEALVFHSSLGDRVAEIRHRLPGLRHLIEVPDDNNRCADVLRYDDVVAANEPAQRIARTGDELYMLYTGGTTGMPKGVMYATGTASQFFLDSIALGAGHPPFATTDDIAAFVGAGHAAGALPRSMPCCPLMHGTGCWLGGFIPHNTGGTVVLMEGRGLDCDELWQTVERHRVTSAVIVGDAFARPMLRALADKAAAGAPYDTSSLVQMVSSGAMFSIEVKNGLVSHIPNLTIMDVLGSTEGGMGRSMQTSEAGAPTAKFALNPGTMVFDEDDSPIKPGSGAMGMVGATSANPPLGYYKDPEKSARTFREIGSVRYTFPGDMATVEADGSITLLGRGSNCINTGGEKVFPEEVEEAVKTHPDVDDCLVFGIDDERFGQQVVGVASVRPDGQVDPAVLMAHTRTRLSPYKVPRELVIVDVVPRAANGKADYVSAREQSGLA